MASKLRQQLDDSAIQRNLRTGNSILVLAVFPENLYRGDRISFEFVTWQDRFIFAKDQIVAALDYLGGNVPDIGRLITLGQLEAIKLGMPGPFTQFPQILPAGSVQTAETTVLHGRGVYRVTLLAAHDLIRPRRDRRDGFSPRSSQGRSKVILGIDPGTRKCGYAVMTKPGEPPVKIGIVETGALAGTVADLLRAYPIEAIALGGGTNTAPVAAQLARCNVPLHVVDERETTLRARARYFIDHPPRGWKRLVPRGMLLPPRPIDDYAALLIAERFVAAATPAG